MCNVKGILESHWKIGILVFPQKIADCAEVLTCFIKFKDIILHTNVKFHEKLVSNALANDIHDDRQRILLLLDHFVKLSEIADPMNNAIFLGNDEGGT